MVNHSSVYNKIVRNYDKGFMLILLLAIIFFWTGLAIAIKTIFVGLGVIMVILGIFGTVISIIMIVRIRKLETDKKKNYE
jgi:hypothetical protein